VFDYVLFILVFIILYNRTGMSHLKVTQYVFLKTAFYIFNQKVYEKYGQASLEKYRH